MSETAVKSKIEVTSFTDAHCAVVADFFRQVWDPGATQENVRAGRRGAIASNPFQPGQEVPTVLFLQDGKVLGYVSSIPVSLWNGATEQATFWVKGLMVLPEHRNGPIGYYLVKELLKTTPCALSLTVASASRRLFQSLGFHELGMLTNHLRVLRPAAMASRLDLRELGAGRLPNWLLTAFTATQTIGLASAGAVLGNAVLSCFAAIRTPSMRGLELSYPAAWPDAAEIDALWSRMRTSLRCSMVRDSRYLPWRYDIHGTAKYGLAVVRQAGELAALAVLRRPSANGDPRLNGIRLAVISDIVCDLSRPELLHAVLQGCDRLGAHFEADAILCSTSSTALRTVMSRAGYLPAPGNLYFLWREAGGDGRLSNQLSDWWLARGDMNADEVF
jgi:hypothetical protein